MADLESCPFCGGRAAFVPRAVNIALQKDPSDPKFGVSVICGKCGAESANYVDEAHAARAWNRRTAGMGGMEATDALREYVEAHDAWDPAANLHGRTLDQIAKETRLRAARQRAREAIAGVAGPDGEPITREPLMPGKDEQQ